MPISKILWGPTFENELLPGYSLFDIVTDREPRDGSEWAQASSGAEDALITGRDYTLQCNARFIPDGPGASPVQSALSGPTGWQAFLDWARDKNPLRFVPDQANPLFYLDNVYLVDPLKGFGSLGADLKRTVPLKFRTASVDFHQALRGLMLEYAPGGLITDPVAWAFSRGSVASRTGANGLLASEAIDVLRDRHYEAGLRTTLLEGSRATMLDNSGLEADNNGWFAAVGATATRDNTHAFQGSWAEKIVIQAATLNSGGGAQLRAGTNVPVTVGQPYSGSCVVYADPGTAAVGKLFKLVLEWRDGGGGFLSNNSMTQVLVAGWQQLQLNNAIAPASAVTTRILFVSGAGTDPTYTVWVDVPQIENAAFASSPIVTGTTVLTRSTDAFSRGWPYGPQPLWLYVKFVEHGNGATVRGLVHVGALGTAAPGIFDINWSGTFYRVSFGDATSGFVEATLAAAPAVGAIVELLALLFADGHVEIHQSINGAAETVATNATTKTLPVAWNAPTFILGARDAGSEAFKAIASVRAGPGTTVNTIALARAA